MKGIFAILHKNNKIKINEEMKNNINKMLKDIYKDNFWGSMVILNIKTLEYRMSNYFESVEENSEDYLNFNIYEKYFCKKDLNFIRSLDNNSIFFYQKEEPLRIKGDKDVHCVEIKDDYDCELLIIPFFRRFIKNIIKENINKIKRGKEHIVFIKDNYITIEDLYGNNIALYELSREYEDKPVFYFNVFNDVITERFQQFLQIHNPNSNKIITLQKEHKKIPDCKIKFRKKDEEYFEDIEFALDEWVMSYNYSYSDKCCKDILYSVLVDRFLNVDCEGFKDLKSFILGAKRPWGNKDKYASMCHVLGLGNDYLRSRPLPIFIEERMKHLFNLVRHKAIAHNVKAR